MTFTLIFGRGPVALRQRDRVVQLLESFRTINPQKVQVVTLDPYYDWTRLEELAKRVDERLEHRAESAFDRHHLVADTQRRGDVGRIVLAPLARVARRHAYPQDVFRPERIHSHGGDQAGIDSARQPEHHLVEARLAYVVARTEDQGLVRLLDGSQVIDDRTVG